MKDAPSNTKKRSGLRGRPDINSELCKGCGLCVAICPKIVLSMSKKTNNMGIPFAVYDMSGNCTACKNCAIICPDRAISIYKSVVED